MSLCFCSLTTRPSLPIHESNLQWPPPTPIPKPPLKVRLAHFATHATANRVFQQGIEIVSPDAEPRIAVVDAKDEVQQPHNGAVAAKTQSSSNRVKKKRDDDDDSDDNRFKLRNGREVSFL